MGAVMSRAIFSVVAGALLAAGCADTFLDEQEALVDRRPVSAASTLGEQSDYARRMAAGYVAAARGTGRVQDVVAGLVFVSAASVVSGAVGTASNEVLARRGLVGAGVARGASRTVPQTAIKGLYTGAKRMNCIATMAGIGVELIGEGTPTASAARTATYGAIQEARIQTRESLARDVPEYGDLLSGLAEDVGAGLDLGFETAAMPRAAVDQKLLNTYLGLLSKCLAKTDPTQAGADVR